MVTGMVTNHRKPQVSKRSVISTQHSIDVEPVKARPARSIVLVCLIGLSILGPRCLYAQVIRGFFPELGPVHTPWGPLSSTGVSTCTFPQRHTHTLSLQISLSNFFTFNLEHLVNFLFISPRKTSWHNDFMAGFGAASCNRCGVIFNKKRQKQRYCII